MWKEKQLVEINVDTAGRIDDNGQYGDQFQTEMSKQS